MLSMFDKQLTNLIEDNQSGSRALASRAAVLFRKIIEAEDSSRPRLIKDLRDACKKLEKAHSSMASMRALCDDVIMILDAAPPLEALKERLAGMLDGWDQMYSQRLILQISTNVYPLLKGARKIVSHSYSTTVFEVVAQLAKKMPATKFFQSVSFPAREGVKMAELLAGLNMDVELIADAGMAEAVGKADLVLIGSDSITSTGLINKQGTFGIALAARHFGKPVLVVADSTKISDAESPVAIPRKKPDELAVVARSNILVTNTYFDITPLDLITKVITEKGVFTPKEIR